MENTINVQMSKEFYDEIMANVPQEGGGSINAKYLGLGVVNINEGYTLSYAYPSECTTWEEVIDNLNYPTFLISNGYVNFMEDTLNSYPLYYDADLTQRVYRTDKPLSQDYYTEGYSGGASGN